MRWRTPNVAAMLKHENAGVTTSANVGAYQVPLGRPVARAPVGPAGAQDQYRRKNRSDVTSYGGYTPVTASMLPSKI